MLNYVTINRCYDKIKNDFDPNEEEIKMNFEKIITNFLFALVWYVKICKIE